MRGGCKRGDCPLFLHAIPQHLSPTRERGKGRSKPSLAGASGSGAAKLNTVI
jgi:hypothetical protein